MEINNNIIWRLNLDDDPLWPLLSHHVLQSAFNCFYSLLRMGGKTPTLYQSTLLIDLSSCLPRPQSIQSSALKPIKAQRRLKARAARTKPAEARGEKRGERKTAFLFLLPLLLLPPPSTSSSASPTRLSLTSCSALSLLHSLLSPFSCLAAIFLWRLSTAVV